MAGPVLFCPACVVAVPETHVEWEAIRATCARCDLVLVLDGDLVPQAPVSGFPDRLVAHRVSLADSGAWRVTRDGATTVVARAGLLARIFAPSVRVSPAGVELGSRLGRASVRLDSVRGVVPIQTVRWLRNQRRMFDVLDSIDDGVPRMTVTTRLFAGDSMRAVFEHDDYDAALQVASLLNAALDVARHAGAPYRG